MVKHFVLLVVLLFPMLQAGSVWSIMGVKNRRYRHFLETHAPDLKKALMDPREPITALLPARFQESAINLPLLHYSVLTEAVSVGNQIIGPRLFTTMLKGGEWGSVLPAGEAHGLMLNVHGRELYFGGIRVKEVVVASNGRGCVAILDGQLAVPALGTGEIRENSLLPEILDLLERHIERHEDMSTALTILAPRRNAYWTQLTARLSPQTVEALLLAHVVVGGQFFTSKMTHGRKLRSLTRGITFEINNNSKSNNSSNSNNSNNEKSKGENEQERIFLNGRKLIQYDVGIRYGVAHVVERPLIGGKELLEALSRPDKEKTDPPTEYITPADCASTSTIHGDSSTTNEDLHRDSEVDDSEDDEGEQFDIQIEDVPDPNTLLSMEEGLDTGPDMLGPPLHPLGCPFDPTLDDDPLLPPPYSYYGSPYTPYTPNPSNTDNNPPIKPTKPNIQSTATTSVNKPNCHQTPNTSDATTTTNTNTTTTSSSSNNTNTDSATESHADISKRKIVQEGDDLMETIVKGIIIMLLAVMAFGGIGFAVYLVQKSRQSHFTPYPPSFPPPSSSVGFRQASL